MGQSYGINFYRIVNKFLDPWADALSIDTLLARSERKRGGIHCAYVEPHAHGCEPPGWGRQRDKGNGSRGWGFG
eukprot:1146684-Pelagomonas_calceolata.AAC.2